MPLLMPRRLQARYNFPSDAATWQFKLPNRGAISSLDVFVEWVNGGTSNKDQDVYDIIDKIELVANGSKVLWSCTGMEALKWGFVFLGQRPNYYRSEVADITQVGHIHIPFGFYTGDPNHYLPLQSNVDIELRITYSPTVGATGFLTGSGYVTVYANMWNDAAPGALQGFLRLQEMLYVTSAASGEDFYDFPTGNQHIAYGLYVYESGIDPQTNVDTVELSLNSGSLIPVTGRFEDLNSLFTKQLGIIANEEGVAFKSDTDTIETRVGTVGSFSQEKEQSLTIGTTDEFQNIVGSIAGGLVTLESLARDAAATASDAANTTDMPIKWLATPRYGLGNFLCVPFALPNRPENALMSNDYGRVRFTMAYGNAGAEVRLSLLEMLPNLQL